ncbi:hypothetical protein [Gimesia fumaroli]|nr:hypothetical protein [Gimesia fumaroli]
MDHEPYTDYVDGYWNGPQEQPFNIPNPAAAGLMPGNFFGQGIFPFGTSLFGTGFGSSSGRAPRTDLPPIASGTTRDGTYWERFDNGTIWIYREYNEEGGKLIREEWGRHVLSLPDLLAKYKVFLNEREKLTDNDRAFMDPIGLMNDLNKEKIEPEEKTAADKLAETLKNTFERLSLAETIKGLDEQINDPEISPGAKRLILLRLGKLIKRYERLGGDVAELELSNQGQGEQNKRLNGILKNDAYNRILVELFLKGNYSTLADSSGPNLQADLSLLSEHFGKGFLEGFYSDIESTAEILGGASKSYVQFYDLTPNNYASDYAFKMLESLGFTVPDDPFARFLNVSKKLGKLGTALIYEKLFGSSDKSEELYQNLKSLVSAEFELSKAEVEAVIDLLKIAVDEIAHFDDWTAEEKAYVTGRLAYELASLLIPGGAIAKGGLKAAKGTKFAQLVTKISKSEKLAKLRKTFGPDTRVGRALSEFWYDEYGAIPNPLNFSEGHENLLKLRRELLQKKGNGKPGYKKNPLKANKNIKGEPEPSNLNDALREMIAAEDMAGYTQTKETNLGKAAYKLLFGKYQKLSPAMKKEFVKRFHKGYEPGTILNTDVILTGPPFPYQLL